MLTLHRDECARAEYFRGEQISNFYLEKGKHDPARFPFLNPRGSHERAAHSLSKQSPNEIFKLNFAHQTPDHAHSHGKI